MKILKAYQRCGDYLIQIPIDTTQDGETIPIQNYRKVVFSVSSADRDANFFEDNLEVPNASDFTVFINDERAECSFNSLSYDSYDFIIIRLDNTASNFPFWRPPSTSDAISNNVRVKYRINEIFDPLPPMFVDGCTEQSDFSRLFYFQDIKTVPSNLFVENTSVTSFAECFSNCYKMDTIPPRLFLYATQVQSFSSCFKCTDISSIPNDLFRNCQKVTDFSNCFSGDTVGEMTVAMHITELPPYLFKYNTNVVDFSGCFQYNLVDSPELAKSIVFKLLIGSPNVTKCDNFCSECMKMELYVPADSDTFNSFEALGMENITLKTFTDINSVII